MVDNSDSGRAASLASLTLNLITESFRILQHPHNKIERSFIKIIAWIVGIIIFLIAGGIIGHKSFRAWQERRLVAQANALVNEGNLKRASLDARRILQINPDSVEGCRIMARISEEGGSRTAVDWRRRAVDLGGGKAADLLALAKTAARFGDKPSQDYAMSRLPEETKATAEYHLIAADIAGKNGDTAAVEKHLREASRLDPANKNTRVRLATLQLAAADEPTRAEGRRLLTELQADPEVRREATRRLAEDALRRQDLEGMMRLGQQLESFPDKTFEDRLFLLTGLHGSLDPRFTPFLQELQTAAVADPEHVAALLAWLNGNQMPAAAISWAGRLPPELLTQKAVPIALSDSYVAAKDWEGMLRMMQTGNWGGLDFLRSALQARASRELGNESDSAAQWNEALKKVTATPKQALVLAEIVKKWGWQKETIDVLWVAAKDPVAGDQALQALYRHFAQQGQTQDLYRVLLHRHEANPDDRDVQNNVAQLSLLLNLNADRGQKLARDLYEKEPGNAAYASTHAYGLHVQGDTKKALKIFSDMPPDEQRKPEIAAYYGIILAASGDHERAAEFLDLGEKAGLLPEEKTLVERARRALARR